MSTTPPQLSFDRADLSSPPPPANSCSFCKRGLIGQYFRVNSRLACEACAAQAQGLVPSDTHAAFSRALVFGAVAAVIGCAAYAALAIATGWTIGYAAIGVGYIIGWAMKKGSNGLGGRRYQIAAAILTYAAVSIAAVPIDLHYHSGAGQSLSVIGVLVLGLASPLLAFTGSFAGAAINLFILFLGIRFAWRFTAGRRIDVEGPFTSTRTP